MNKILNDDKEVSKYLNDVYQMVGKVENRIINDRQSILKAKQNIEEELDKLPIAKGLLSKSNENQSNDQYISLEHANSEKGGPEKPEKNKNN